ncbi:MAG: mechanosensitive ion channel family protein [Bacillota bacterium]
MDAARVYLLDILEGYFHQAIAAILVVFAVVFFFLVVGVFTNKVLSHSLKHFLKLKKSDARGRTIGKLITNLIRVVVWFIILIMVLDEFGVQIAPILASAGVLGLAIGFGAQSIVKDFLAGFFFIVEDAYNEGDIVEINGFWGTVEKMGLRATHIKSWKGIVKVVTNGDITSLENYSKYDNIAIVDVGVDYDTDLDKVESIMKPFMEELKGKYDMITEMPSYLGVSELADSSINIRVIAYTVPNTQFGIERKIRKDIVDLFRKNDIGIPFPQLVVHGNES